MNKKNIRVVYLIIIAIALIILGVFLIRTCKDGLGIFFNTPVDYAITGQVGDYFGGIVGTLFSAAGFYLIYVTLQEQRKSFEKERFGSKFYELLRLHRENVTEMEYSKFDDSKKAIQTYRNREVFAIIFDEFLECYRELLSFHKMMKQPEFMTENYKKNLEEIITRNKLKVGPIQIAQIDIAYCIVFYGVSIQSEPILQHLFRKRITNNYYYKLIKYYQLKCKTENSSGLKDWVEFYDMPKEDKLNLFNLIYDNRRIFEIDEEDVIQTIGNSLIKNFKEPHYYNGHHNMLGHYFRHLFQSYKFLNEQDLLFKEKYFYGKSLRAQLSTYEQALIFFNSISSLGRRWELDQEKDTSKNKNFKPGLITTYQIIKNLPGTHFYQIRYARFYPKVKFESYENQI